MADSVLNVILNFIKKGTGDKDAQKGLAGLSDGFKQLTGFSLGSVTALAAVGMGVREITKFANASIKETVSYNKSIREMTQVLGLSAEETSRVIQVADDWGISIEAVRTSLGMMNKNGVQPSIENLADLADEYVNTEDKTVFAEKAAKLLGRQYQTLIPLFAKGGNALRDQTKAINNNLIATDESIQASRDYEVAVDNLNDAWQGIKYTLGNEIIPILGGFLTSITTANSKQNEYNETWKEYRQLIDAGVLSMQDYQDIQHEAAKSSDMVATETQLMSEAIAEANKETIQLNAESDKLDRVHASLGTTTEALTVSEEDLGKAIETTNWAEIDAKREADRLNQAYDDMNTAINGRLGPTIADFNEAQDELNARMEDLQVEIDLATQKYGPMSEEVLGLQGDYDELKGQYTENETEHDRATKEIMFDILEQRAAIGGLTADEIKYLDEIQKAWGLADQATLDYMEQSDESLNWLKTHPGDVKNAIEIINGQESAWSLAKQEAQLARDAIGDYIYKLDQLDGKVVKTTIQTNYEDYGRGTGNRTGYQYGADFVVPPGYPHDSFRMNVSSGERVIVQPANTFNINMTGTGQASADIMSTVRLLELLYG